MGAPRLFSSVFSGVALATGAAVGGGVSLGSGVGEDFLFRSAGEADFFFADGLVDGVLSSSAIVGAGEAFFFFGDALGEGDGDSFFVAVDFFLLCGVGVGVGVVKIFLIASPNDCSAASAEGTADAINSIAARTRKRIAENLTILRRDFSKHGFVDANSSIEIFEWKIFVR